MTQDPTQWLIERERLIRRLDEHGSAPILWLQGPAGIGKSCLAAQYVDHHPGCKLLYKISQQKPNPSANPIDP